MSAMNCVTFNQSIAFCSRRFFASFRGVNLPLRLVSELDGEAILHRGIFFVAYYDDEERMIGCDKYVQGCPTLSHRYEYHPGGTLKRAVVNTAGNEQGAVFFDETGARFAGTNIPRRSGGVPPGLREN